MLENSRVAVFVENIFLVQHIQIPVQTFFSVSDVQSVKCNIDWVL